MNLKKKSIEIKQAHEIKGTAKVFLLSSVTKPALPFCSYTIWSIKIKQQDKHHREH